MKIKVTAPILDYDGTPLKENAIKITQAHVNDFQKLFNEGKATIPIMIDALRKEVEKPELTYRTVIHNALNTLTQDESGKVEVITSTDKAKCYEITLKLFASKEPEFTKDQSGFIISRVEKLYLTPVICGRINEIFSK